MYWPAQRGAMLGIIAESRIRSAASSPTEDRVGLSVLPGGDGLIAASGALRNSLYFQHCHADSPERPPSLLQAGSTLDPVVWRTDVGPAGRALS